MAKITLKAARVNMGMTQSELAEKMGVSRATVTEWEADKRTMRPVYVHLFCVLSGLTEDDFLVPINNTKSVEVGAQ